MRVEHGFIYSRRQRSPSIEPDYDEDDAWWDRLAEEAKDSLGTIRPNLPPDVVATIVEETPTAMHGTIRTTIVEETPSAMHGTIQSNPPPVDTTTIVDETPSAMHGTIQTNPSPVDTAMVVGETPSAMHGTIRTNPPPVAAAMVVEETPSAMHGTNRYNLPPVEHSQLFNRTRVLEVVSLRSELTETQRRADQLQQLLEEDQALHSSDKRTQLHLRYLNKCTHARTAKITGNICTVHIAACHHALHN